MKIVSLAATAAIAAMLLVLNIGCEVESTDQASVTVTPNFATVKEGQAVTFSASGWTDYHWKISDSTIGVLDRTTGSSATYTAIADSALAQILTVTGSAGTATNREATVLIQHELLEPPAAALVGQ